MIDFVKELQSTHCFFKGMKVACGQNFKFIYDRIVDNTIHGYVRVDYNGKFILQKQQWNRYGLPLDLEKYPSKYYLRLVLRKPQ